MPEVRLERPKVAVSNKPACGQSARSVIIGLGNPFFTDDGVGPLLARRIYEHLGSPDMDLAELAAGGVELMEAMVGYRRAVIIDAILTGKGAPGSCYLLDLDHSPPTRHANMSHEIGLLEGLELGRRLGLLVPDSIRVYAIEVVDPLTFGTAVTDEVKREIPRIALEIASEIGMELCDSSPGRCNRPIEDARVRGVQFSKLPAECKSSKYHTNCDSPHPCSRDLPAVLNQPFLCAWVPHVGMRDSFDKSVCEAVEHGGADGGPGGKGWKTHRQVAGLSADAATDLPVPYTLKTGADIMAKEEEKSVSRAEIEEAVLKQYGLRWAVLAGWRDALQLRRVVLPHEADHYLENARIKIASGCFSVCEVGCDLSQLEALLTVADASSSHNWVDFWVDLLGHAMAYDAETERILKIPAIRARYNNCGLTICRC